MKNRAFLLIVMLFILSSVSISGNTIQCEKLFIKLASNPEIQGTKENKLLRLEHFLEEYDAKLFNFALLQRI